VRPLGYFATKVDAAICYAKWARQERRAMPEKMTGYPRERTHHPRLVRARVRVRVRVRVRGRVRVGIGVGVRVRVRVGGRVRVRVRGQGYTHHPRRT